MCPHGKTLTITNTTNFGTVKHIDWRLLLHKQQVLFYYHL